MPDIGSHPKLIAEILLENNLITKEQYDIAMDEHEKTGERVGSILVKRGFVSQAQVGKILQEQVGIPYVNLGVTEISKDVLKIIPENLTRRLKVLPVKIENNTLYVAMLYPINYNTIDELKLITGKKIKPMITTERELSDAVNRYFDVKETAKSAIEEFKGVKPSLDVSPTMVETAVEELQDQAPVVRLVNSIIIGAISRETSDIHLDPQLTEMRVRYRIDGVLYEAMTIPLSMQKAVVSRIKIMAGLNIAEQRLPQDGQFTFKYENKEYDMRISTLPTRFGETVVIRILDKEKVIIGLSLLGMLSDELQKFEEIISLPSGMIIVSGPTGCGKTTTLYSVLHYQNTSEKSIVTIEDPIEFHLPGISQVQVNPKGGITFATGLRAILRQDPNIVMVGEIRDEETAKISIHAALTGQLVLSTIHTPDAPSVLVRLLEMGIETFLISSTIIGIISQRLVRIICPSCKEEYKPAKDVLNYFPKEMNVKVLYRGKGCQQCNFSGYKGRTGIFEVMKMNKELRDLVLYRAPASEIRHQALQSGMRPLFESGMIKVAQGITTIDEVLRVAPREE